MSQTFYFRADPEKISFNVKYNLGCLSLSPCCNTSCILVCLCTVLLLLATISNWPHNQETSTSQEWRIPELGSVNNDPFGKEVSPFFFFPPLPFKLSLGLWKKVGFFKDKSPQADFPQSSSFSHGHLRSAVICRLIRGRACPSWPCLWQRHLGLHVREEWLVSPARESCRTWLGENGQLTGDRRNFFPLRLLNLVLFFVMNQHWFSVLMFWFILVCASWFLDAAGSL